MYVTALHYLQGRKLNTVRELLIFFLFTTIEMFAFFMEVISIQKSK